MRVLLTGGNGFIATHIVNCLLQRGHSVVFTVRSREKGERVMRKHRSTTPDDLSYIIVKDITLDNAFDAAVQSHLPFNAVIHPASPYHFNVTDRQKDLLDPAILGTKGLLQAIKKNAPSVKRVVVTSSFAAMVMINSHPEVYDESNWNDVTLYEALNTDLFTAWRSSKAFAEKAAWEFMDTQNLNFQLSTINPPLVFGPLEHYCASLDNVNTSNMRIRDMIQGKMKDGLAPTGIFIWADVRDVALAHVLAIENPEAAGKRFLCAAGFFSNADIAHSVRRNFPTLEDKFPETIVSDLDRNKKPFEIDNSRSQKLLGLEYRSLEESVVDTVESLLAI